MHELNLIPDDYRQLQRARQYLKAFSIFYICLLITIALAKFSLSDKLEEIETTLEDFEEKKHLQFMQERSLAGLLNTKIIQEKRVEVLRKLRNGSSAYSMFTLMDRVMEEGIWFTRWSFRRGGEIKSVEHNIEFPDYFIQIDEGLNTSNRQVWAINTQMNLKGLALNHGHLTVLVEKLLEQTEVTDVKIIKTMSAKHKHIDVIDFELVITINSQYSA